jgi:hypothetical protein
MALNGETPMLSLLNQLLLGALFLVSILLIALTTKTITERAKPGQEYVRDVSEPEERVRVRELGLP